MVLPCDYHMHTPLCLHATGEPSDYAAYAVKIGLNAIGFSDHSPMAKDGFDDWRMRLDQLDEYVGSVIKARKDHPSLIVKLGLEVDYIPGHEDWIKHLRSLHPWDYFIGSVHYVSDVWDLDNPKKLSEWKTRDAYDVWKIYFERLTKAAGSGLFETIAHADLPKKFNFYPTEDCSHLFDHFLSAAASTDTAIELNTAGLRKDCREIYPSPKILQMAKTRGVAITFGSDAHAPGEVASDFDQAIRLARSCGYADFRTFDKGTRSSLPIR